MQDGGAARHRTGVRGETPGGIMRISRFAVLPAIAALGAAGAILASPAMAATTSHTTVYLHQTHLVGGAGYVYLHQ